MNCTLPDGAIKQKSSDKKSPLKKWSFLLRILWVKINNTHRKIGILSDLLKIFNRKLNFCVQWPKSFSSRIFSVPLLFPFFCVDELPNYIINKIWNFWWNSFFYFIASMKETKKKTTTQTIWSFKKIAIEIMFLDYFEYAIKMFLYWAY